MAAPIFVPAELCPAQPGTAAAPQETTVALTACEYLAAFRARPGVQPRADAWRSWREPCPGHDRLFYAQLLFVLTPARPLWVIRHAQSPLF